MIRTSPVISISLLAATAAAQTTPVDNRFTLGTVTVTAQRVDNMDPPTLVIPQKEIELLDVVRLSDVRATQP